MLAFLEETRRRTLDLVGRFPAADLEKVHSPLMSPLVWDLGHIAAFEDLWLVRRLGRGPMLRQDLARVYDAFETPRSDRGELPYLRTDAALSYLAEVRARVHEIVFERGPGDGALLELVVRHERQHTETMLQTIELGHLEAGAGVMPRPPAPPAPAGPEWVEVEGGEAEIGAGPEGFAYDNERPRHRVRLAPFAIARRPVTNATFLTFVEGGGYERREWWSREGWAWKEEEDIHGPGEWTADGREWRAGEGHVPLLPERPVVHVSFHEAAAFARAHAARLPTELEWEHAAARDLLAGRHEVWEWTSSEFRPYPGFVADPYRQYSEPFFGAGYRVLRGGSRATPDGVASSTFRNWDHPERRQIFSGLRLARDP